LHFTCVGERSEEEIDGGAKLSGMTTIVVVGP
jgi:hypothetical protein